MDRLNWLESMVIIYKSCLRKTFTYSGRASRMEFWSYLISNLILLGILYPLLQLLAVAGWIFHEAGILQEKAFSCFLMLVSINYLIVLATVIVSTLAVSIRRLHDTSRPATLVFLNLLPFIGQIVLLVFMVEAGSPQTNNHGEPPTDQQFLYRNVGTMP